MELSQCLTIAIKYNDDIIYSIVFLYMCYMYMLSICQYTRHVVAISPISVNIRHLRQLCFLMDLFVDYLLLVVWHHTWLISEFSSRISHYPVLKVSDLFRTREKRQNRLQSYTIYPVEELHSVHRNGLLSHFDWVVDTIQWVKCLTHDFLHCRTTNFEHKITVYRVSAHNTICEWHQFLIWRMIDDDDWCFTATFVHTR